MAAVGLQRVTGAVAVPLASGEVGRGVADEDGDAVVFVEPRVHDGGGCHTEAQKGSGDGGDEGGGAHVCRASDDLLFSRGEVVLKAW